MNRVETQRAFLKVVGMFCSSCKPIVEKQLQNEEAVKKTEIDYMTDSVIADFNPSLITKEQIKNKLSGSGYKLVRIATFLWCLWFCWHVS
jgi:copper chaperone